MNGTAESYAYDDGDKLQSVSGGGTAVKTYGYDAAGRTTSVVSSAGTTTLAYDYEGRATSISGPGVSQTNAYNGLDTRTSSTTNSVASTYLRDGALVTSSVLKDGAATYTLGVSERRGSVTTFSHAGVKNVDAQSNAAQTISATRVYDAFGNLATSTGSFAGPFGYGGSYNYQEDATGLKLLGHRLYDASTGRFLTRDPVKDGRNWYAYCGGDPVNGADPTGEFLFIVWLSQTAWWGGTDTTDFNGNPVRVGGWTAVLNSHGNAMTYNGTVHVDDFSVLENYLNDPHWQNHEEGHIDQGMNGGMILTTYAACALLGAIAEFEGGPLPGHEHSREPLGHDYNFWERLADQYADQKEGIQR